MNVGLAEQTPEFGGLLTQTEAATKEVRLSVAFKGAVIGRLGVKNLVVSACSHLEVVLVISGH